MHAEAIAHRSRLTRAEAPGHVVITGASAGVGRAAAVAFGARGWRVSLLARGARRLESAVDEVERAGGRGLSLPTDVADARAVEAAATEAERVHGPIDVWMNSAMVTVYAPVAEIRADEYRRVTEVTYLGQVHGTMSALARMRPRNQGTIVSVSSALAYHGLPLQAAYCGAKFAARGFMESLRGELLHEQSNIRLSTVVLPAVNTPQFDWARNKLPCRPRPVPPVYQPEAVAEALVQAAETAPRELVLGLSSLKLIAGSMTAPGVVDHILAREAWAGEQDDDPARPRADNLFEPVDGCFGSRGRFDDVARSDLGRVALGTVRRAGALLAVVAGAGLAAGSYALGRASARRQHE